jgi:hypothetical protein
LVQFLSKYCYTEWHNKFTLFSVMLNIYAWNIPNDSKYMKYIFICVLDLKLLTSDLSFSKYCKVPLWYPTRNNYKIKQTLEATLSYHAALSIVNISCKEITKYCTKMKWKISPVCRRWKYLFIVTIPLEK